MAGGAAFHWLAYSLGIQHANTQTSDAERRMIASYAQTASLLLEVGVFEGVTTRVIAEAMPASAQLYAVDPFFRGRFGVNWTRQIARAEVAKARIKSVHFVELLSEQAARVIDENFDFIFIDADHSLKGIKTDWSVWSPRCHVGGVMAFHDTRIASHAAHVAEFGSFQFYNEVISTHPDFEEVNCVDTVSIIQRVK
jgi:predicted O-methyltransferase YrrM